MAAYASAAFRQRCCPNPIQSIIPRPGYCLCLDVVLNVVLEAVLDDVFSFDKSCINLIVKLSSKMCLKLS